MEKQLNPNLRLTLRELCLRKTTVYLWNANNMLVSIAKFQFEEHSSYNYRKYWRQNMEVKMKYNVSKLALPDSLKRKVVPLIRPIGTDILRWKLFLELFIFKGEGFFEKHILEHLRWTCEGSLDHRKTAEEILRLELFDLVRRYRLACLYCFEDQIRLLWEQLPETTKWSFHGGHDFFRVRDMQLEYYWPYVLKGEESQLRVLDYDSFNRLAFDSSARNGNKAVNEYFFRKLPNEERYPALLTALNAAMYRNGGQMFNWPKAFVQGRLGDVVCHMLSLMSPERQMELLKNHPCGVLNCLHDWPHHEVFLNIANVIWRFLPESKYDDLLRIVRNSGFYFPNLFQNFFIGSPSGFRKHFVNRECRICLFFVEFLNDEDTETIKVVFKNIDLEDRMKLVTCYNFFKLLNRFVMVNRENVVELCLQEASLPKENKERLKETYKGFLAKNEDTPDALSKKRKWERLFEFLDETDADVQNKRNSEDETPAKMKIPRQGRTEGN